MCNYRQRPRPTKRHSTRKKILILGASGMLGNAMFRVLSQSKSLEVFGTTRNQAAKIHFTKKLSHRLVIVKNLEDAKQLSELLDFVVPHAVVNCTALAREQSKNFKRLISVFSLLPRRLQHLCRTRNIRLIHFGSDGVFSGKRGGYTEDDLPDGTDPYAIAKTLGDVEGPRTLTLRTSMLGPELAAHNGLLCWFLKQEKKCCGYTRAFFSGFPTVVLAQIVRDIVLPNESLHGIYHLASEPISKFNLLSMVAERYSKKIKMIPDDSLVIDRSLSDSRFRLVTGYAPPSWKDMIATMYAFKGGLRKG